MKSAIIGLGVIGAVHTAVLRERGDNIAAVCDIDSGKFKDFPDSLHYTDYIKMLDEVKPDAVHICTPHYLHADMIIACLERNINVLCEKPMCIKYKDIARIIKAQEKSDAILGICHQNRYNSTSIFAKDWLKDKRVVGGFASVVWHRDEKYYLSAPWRGKWESEGGGVLINQSLHTLDLLEWMAGEPDYAAAVCTALTLGDLIEVEDSAMAHFSGKVNFDFYATLSSVCDYPVEVNIVAENKEGRRERITFTPSYVLVNGQKTDFKSDGKIYSKYCYGSGHAHLIDDFYSCITEKRPFPIDGKEGGKVIKLILACHKSGGKRVKIEPEASEL